MQWQKKIIIIIIIIIIITICQPMKVKWTTSLNMHYQS